MRTIKNYTKSGCAIVIGILFLTSCHNGGEEKKASAPADTTASEIKLPPGFSVTVVADSLGALRHIAVTKNGDIYVKLSSLKDGKGIYFLSDTDRDGKMDKRTGFGNYPGTGIRIKGDELYSSSNSTVYRYKLNDRGEVIDTGKGETIVQGLIDMGRDNSKSIALDNDDNLYVTVGSYDETFTDKTGHGILNSPLLDSVGGIWQFKADKPDQTYGAAPFARGLKNVVGLDWNEATKSLFALQHGRGGLNAKFPKLYTPEQDKALPAETMYELTKGADAGWPYVYYDPFLNKKIVAPEYGGDAKKSVDNKYLDPLVAFPAHLGPGDLLFYTGSQFPERYKNGAFIVFHGQAQPLHKGYFIAFVPFKDGKPSGQWETFADNFVGVDLANTNGSYHHRPIGIAQGPDGSLYVADDLKGTLFKITYPGGKK